jgi:hypothetical protein
MARTIVDTWTPPYRPGIDGPAEGVVRGKPEGNTPAERLEREHAAMLAALVRLRREHFVAGGEMGNWEAIDLICTTLGFDPLTAPPRGGSSE